MTSPRPLTPQRARLLAFWRSHSSLHGHPPSILEARAALGLSHQGIFHHLRALAAQGLLRRSTTPHQRNVPSSYEVAP